jgi:hypothetical protein
MQLKDIAPSYGLGLLIALAVFFFKFFPLSYWIVLPLQIIVGITIFFLVCKLTKMQEYEEVKGMVMPMLNKLKIRNK